MGWISQRVKTIVLSRVRTSYSSYLRISHTFCISPRTSPKLGLVLTLCEIDPLDLCRRVLSHETPQLDVELDKHETQELRLNPKLTRTGQSPHDSCSLHRRYHGHYSRIPTDPQTSK